MSTKLNSEKSKLQFKDTDDFHPYRKSQAAKSMRINSSNFSLLKSMIKRRK